MPIFRRNIKSKNYLGFAEERSCIRRRDALEILNQVSKAGQLWFMRMKDCVLESNRPIIISSSLFSSAAKTFPRIESSL